VIVRPSCDVNAQGYTIINPRYSARKVIVGAMRQNNIKGTFSAHATGRWRPTIRQKNRSSPHDKLTLRMIVINADPFDANSGGFTSKNGRGDPEQGLRWRRFRHEGQNLFEGDSGIRRRERWGRIDRKTLNQPLHRCCTLVSHPGKVQQKVVQIGDAFYILYCASKKTSELSTADRSSGRNQKKKKLEQVQRARKRSRSDRSLRRRPTSRSTRTHPAAATSYPGRETRHCRSSVGYEAIMQCLVSDCKTLFVSSLEFFFFEPFGLFR